MGSVIRAIIVYMFLILLFRIVGRRSLLQTTTFDLILLIIVSEATQNALLGDDNSLTNSFLVITTLVGIDIFFSLWKQRSTEVEKLLDGVPVILVEEGEPLRDRMKNARVDDDEIMMAARELQGLERLEQIKYAVLERSGRISIIPK
jgi:uncharacterized membrane protein YcaP (DUF421 family)